MEISSTFFPDKPYDLTSYEFDVLYPVVRFLTNLNYSIMLCLLSIEIFKLIYCLKAVIWAIMEMEKISYAEANSKYLYGFKRSKEENIKRRCICILNDHPSIIFSHINPNPYIDHYEPLAEI